MIKIDLNKLELNEFTAENYPKQHCRAAFPLLGAHGSKETASVYFELNPGEELGSHTDSAEEILLILEGNVEVTVGSETSSASYGQMVLVPKLVKHNIVNTGFAEAKVLGFFGGANNIVAVFDRTWLPVHSNTVDTAAASAVPAV